MTFFSRKFNATHRTRRRGAGPDRLAGFLSVGSGMAQTNVLRMEGGAGIPMSLLVQMRLNRSEDNGRNTDADNGFASERVRFDNFLCFRILASSAAAYALLLAFCSWNPVWAQSTLVSNSGRTSTTTTAAANKAQAFTTGANTHGYDLSEIRLHGNSFSSALGNTVTLREGSRTGAKVADFTASVAMSGEILVLTLSWESVFDGADETADYEYKVFEGSPTARVFPALIDWTSTGDVLATNILLERVAEAYTIWLRAARGDEKSDHTQIGAYVYRLVAGDKTITRPMVLVK